MTSNIQIETDKDRIVNTQTIPGLKVNMDNLEIASDEPNKKPRIEIPEREANRLDRFNETDSSSDAQKDTAADFKFLINPKKYNPLPKEEIAPIPEVKKSDTDSEKSRKSSRSRFSARLDGMNKDKDDSSEYKPRISTIGSSFKPFTTTSPLEEPAVSSTPNFFGTTFTTRKSVESMTEDDIRRTKSQYLDLYEKRNKDSMYSPKRLSMKNDLEEIRSELEYITVKKQKENMMGYWKRGLCMFVQSAVIVNNYANDPFDIDLSDWSKEVYWDVYRANKYDEVLEDLIDKYHQSKVPISPEWKLAFMMGSSLVWGVMQKKEEKAKIKKRLEEEKRMEEKVRSQVRDEISRMQFMQQGSSSGNVPQQQQMNRNGLQQNFSQKGRPPQSNYDVAYDQMQQMPQMSGPSTSLTDDKIMKMMEENFIDSTIALDDSSVSTSSSKLSKVSKASVKSKPSEPAASTPVKRRAGRPRKSESAVLDETTDLVTADVGNVMESLGNIESEKTITLPVGPRGAVGAKRRGRPPKNSASDNAITVERF